MQVFRHILPSTVFRVSGSNRNPGCCNMTMTQTIPLKTFDIKHYILSLLTKTLNAEIILILGGSQIFLRLVSYAVFPLTVLALRHSHFCELPLRKKHPVILFKVPAPSGVKKAAQYCQILKSNEHIAEPEMLRLGRGMT